MNMNHPVFEALEGRTLLSGNIAAGAASGNLTLTGDALDNSVTLTRHGDTVTLTPDAGTSINHAPPGVAVDLIGVTGKVTIRMGSGNDSVTLTGQAIEGGGEPFAIGGGAADLSVDMGKGDDVLILAGVQARNVSIVTGAGENSVTVTGLDPDAAPGEAQDVQSLFLGNLKVQGSSGSEAVSLLGVRVAGAVTLKLSTGGNSAIVAPFHGSDADFNVSVGGDFVFDSSFARQANTVTFEDPDDVGSITIAGALRISLGLVDDGVSVEPEADLSVGTVLFINGCYGNDTFNLANVDVAGLFILNSGAGDDAINLTNVTPGLAQWIDGQLTIPSYPSFSLPRGLSQSIQNRWISSGTCPVLPRWFF
ncbi:MAG: hypothetical protein WCK05_08875 [Planctomycetota bacterium]